MAFSLGILTLLVLSFALPMEARGETAGYVNPYNSNPPQGPVVIYEQPIIRVKQSTQTYSNNPKYANEQTSTRTNTTENEVTPVEDKYGSLAANAVYGGSSFAPSGLVQWIMLAILVLVIVILARKIFGAADRYHQSPLKHA